MVVFGKSRQGDWWKILPKDEHLVDITSAIGISFGLLVPLFLRTDIIKATITSVENWCPVSLTKLMELSQSVIAIVSFKIEVIRCKYKGKVLFYHYFFLYKPLYGTPGI